MSEILKVEGLRTYYKTRNNEKVFAVDDVSFDLEPGKVLGIAGESGCGKSTLAVSLMGLFSNPLKYETGKIIIDGEDVTSYSKEKHRVEVLGKKIAYIPQSAMNALNPMLKIKNFIFDIMKEHFPEMTRKEVYEMAKNRFNQLNLDERVLDSFPSQLSGGMKQRTVIAVSTIMNPKILVADEPTSALDVSTQKVVMKMLKGLLQKGIVKSMIFITHELPLLYHIADDIFVMYAGEIVEKGTADEMIFHPIHPYSTELMMSIVVPEVGFKNRELSSIPGKPPNLINTFNYCRFAERCKLKTKECELSKIQIEENDKRAVRCIKKTVM